VDSSGFEWIAGNDSEQSVLSFLRFAHGRPPVVVVLNFTPVVRHDYRVGVSDPGAYLELFNSDAHHYAGSGVGNTGRVTAQAVPCHGRPYSLELVLPPLAALFLRLE